MSPDSEQIEQTVAKATIAKVCERGTNSRQGWGGGAVSDEILACIVDERSESYEAGCPCGYAEARNDSLLPSPLEGEGCFLVEASLKPRKQGEGVIEHTLSRISKFAPLTKKFDPLLIQARVNKTVTDFSRLTFHVSQKKRAKRKAAFTLAEVLITLGIIGVVAAMTLPTLIQKQQEKVDITRLKKAYSILSQAYYSAISEYGNSSEWNLGEQYSPDGATEIANKLKPYFKVTQDCGTDKGCFPSVTYKKINGDQWYDIYNTNRSYKIKLSDGTLMAFESNGNTNCQNGNYYCAKVFVDINGADGPNQAAYDMFSFYLLKGRVMPFGYQGDPLTSSVGEHYTGWALINENMDYKRCPEKIGWDKAKSCKE